MPASTLIVQLPPRPRHAARPGGASPESLEQAPLAFVLCDEHRHLLRHGAATVTELPDAAEWIVVPDGADLAWHRLDAAPKAPAAKWRAALVGLLEEHLLEDESELHFAASPHWRAGEPMHVAVTQQAWLQAWLTLLEQRAPQVGRVVPLVGPCPAEAPAQAHVTLRASQAWVCWADAQGVVELPLASPSARRLWEAAMHPDTGCGVQWRASPEAAALASQTVGEPVATVSDVQRLMEVLSSEWNLRQFNLAARHRTDRWLRAGWQRAFHDPAWQRLRWGVLGLLLANLVGAGAWAWQQQRALAERKQAMNALLQATFPQVRAIVDAPAQMSRALDVLRVNAGQPGETDLETLLAAANAVWPEGFPPAQSLQFEVGQLRILAPGWTAQRVQALRPSLWRLGLDAQPIAGGWTLSPLRGEPDRRGLVPAAGSAPAGGGASMPPRALPGPPGGASAAMGRMMSGPGLPPRPGGQRPPVAPSDDMPEETPDENN